MAKRKKTAKVLKTAIKNLLDYSQIENLKDEMEEWADNMSGANMEHLPKYDEVTEAKDALEAAVERLTEGCDELLGIEDEEVKAVLETEIEYKYFPPVGRHISRQTQLEDARDDLQHALDELRHAIENEEWKMEDDLRQTITDALEAIEDGLNECDSVSFPGMF